MSKKNYVIDPRGKRIEVVTTFDPLDHVAPKKRRRSSEQFAMLTEERLKLLKGASGTARAIYSYLLIINWKDLHRSVRLTNSVLAEIGVSRSAKCRALPQLERRGLIEVERSIAREAPLVTPLK